MGHPPLTWVISPYFPDVTGFFNGSLFHIFEMARIGDPWGSKSPADTLSVPMIYQGLEGGGKTSDKLIGCTGEIVNDVLHRTLHIES